MPRTNALQDKVAVVGVGATRYGRDLKRTRISLGLEAAAAAITDAGLTKADIDGICGSGAGVGAHGLHDANFLALQEGLGIDRVTFAVDAPNGNGLLMAVHAIVSGACDTILLVRTAKRSIGNSTSAASDPMRVRDSQLGGGGYRVIGDLAQRWAHSAEPYAAWAGRYMYDYGVPRDVFGLIAVNNRSNAVRNEAALLRQPITMEDYLMSRVIRSPFGMLDLDFPVDAGEALVITRADRAHCQDKPPVLIHAAVMGQTASGAESYENGRDWQSMAPWVAMTALWERSAITLTDIDLFFPYDACTAMAVMFVEAAGYCGPGEAWSFLTSSWSSEQNRLLLNGRTVVCPNGGSLSHGRMGGFNSLTESVMQLRGEAGSRQVPDARTSLVGIGSFYHDPTAFIFQTS